MYCIPARGCNKTRFLDPEKMEDYLDDLHRMAKRRDLLKLMDQPDIVHIRKSDLQVKNIDKFAAIYETPFAKMWMEEMLHGSQTDRLIRKVFKELFKND